MNAIKTIAVVSSILCLPMTALANQPYFGVEGGLQGGVKYQDSQFLDKNKDSGWATRLFVGSKWDNTSAFKHGVEVGINKYETLNAQLNMPLNKQILNTNLKRQGLDVLGVIDYSMPQNVDLFAKGGVAYIKQTGETSVKTYSHDPVGAIFQHADLVHEEKVADVKQSRILPKAVVGAGYNFSSKHSVNVNYSYVFGKNKGKVIPEANNKKNDVLGVDSVMFAYNYHFA